MRVDWEKVEHLLLSEGKGKLDNTSFARACGYKSYSAISHLRLRSEAGREFQRGTLQKLLRGLKKTTGRAIEAREISTDRSVAQ